MNFRSVTPLRILILVAVVLPSAGLLCQETAPSMPPAARLELLDDTYNTNLRRYHGSVIQDYLRELTRLKQTLAARNKESAAAVQVEIDRVQKGNGTLSYEPLKAKPPEPAPGSPPEKRVPKPSDPAAKKTLPSLVLGTDTVAKSKPDAVALTEHPTGNALPVGLAEWRIPKLAAGDYRVSILYSSSSSPEGVNLQVKLGANTVQHALALKDATGGINEFRIARLGVLSLEADATDQVFTLQNSDADKAAVWVRQVILAKK